MRAAIQHPFAIVVLLASIGIAVAMLLAPSLAGWRTWAPWLLVWGAAAYLAAVFGVMVTRPTPSEPELKELESIRLLIRSRLNRRRSQERWAPSELTLIIEDALRHLEHRIMPAMERLLQRQRQLTTDLAAFDSGLVASPEPQKLDGLRTQHHRQQAAIEESVTQAANAAVTLIELLQEPDVESTGDEAKRWARNLLRVYEALEPILSGRQVPVDSEGVEDADPGQSRDALQSRVAEYEQLASDDTSVLRSKVRECLRSLNRPARLARCELMDLLPRSVAAKWSQKNGAAAAPPPLERAQVLREIVLDAIEGLKPTDGNLAWTNPAAIGYNILLNQYVKGQRVDWILARIYQSEAGFAREQRGAIDAIGLHLLSNERESAASPKKSVGSRSDAGD